MIRCAGRASSQVPISETDARGLFEVRMLAPDTVVAQMISVVAPENDDCIFSEIEIIEHVDHLSNLRIGVAGGRVVAVDEFALEIIGQSTIARDAEVCA